MRERQHFADERSEEKIGTKRGPYACARHGRQRGRQIEGAIRQQRLGRHGRHCLKRAKEVAQAAGQTELDPKLLARCIGIYRRIARRALEKNPLIEPTGKRGHPAKGLTRCLSERLDTHEAEVLRFAGNFAVPFDNNQAERGLRMAKVRQILKGDSTRCR